MKTSFLKNTLIASVIATGLSLTSCNDKKTETDTTSTEIDTLNNGGAVESPIDTVVKNNDTIIDTGNASKPNKNPVGTQVP